MVPQGRWESVLPRLRFSPCCPDSLSGGWPLAATRLAQESSQQVSLRNNADEGFPFQDREPPDPVFQEEASRLLDRRFSTDGHHRPGHHLPNTDFFGEMRGLVHLKTHRPGGERLSQVPVGDNAHETTPFYDRQVPDPALSYDLPGSSQGVLGGNSHRSPLHAFLNPHGYSPRIRASWSRAYHTASPPRKTILITDRALRPLRGRRCTAHRLALRMMHPDEVLVHATCDHCLDRARNCYCPHVHMQQHARNERHRPHAVDHI